MEMTAPDPSASTTGASSARIPALPARVTIGWPGLPAPARTARSCTAVVIVGRSASLRQRLWKTSARGSAAAQAN